MWAGGKVGFVADFTVRIREGVTLRTWEDPGVVGVAPSRLNSRPGYPQRRWVGTVGVRIELAAVVAGVEGPDDTDLDGRLFETWFVERPWPPQWLAYDSGRTSVRWFTPPVPGHYTIGFRRHDGGAVHVHIDVEEA